MSDGHLHHVRVQLPVSVAGSHGYGGELHPHLPPTQSTHPVHAGKGSSCTTHPGAAGHLLLQRATVDTGCERKDKRHSALHQYARYHKRIVYFCKAI